MNLHLYSYGSNATNGIPGRADGDPHWLQREGGLSPAKNSHRNQRKDILSRADRDLNWRQRGNITDQSEQVALKILQDDLPQELPLPSLNGRGSKKQSSSSILFKAARRDPVRKKELRQESPHVRMESDHSTHREIMPKDLKSYDSELKAAVKVMDKEKVYQIFAEMEQKGVKPEISTFSLLLSLCAKLRKEDDIPAILTKMRSYGLKYDASIYTTLLNVCAETKNEERAYEILGRMENEKIRLNSISYHTLLKLHVSLGQKEKAFGVFAEMIKKKFHPTDATYRTLLKLYLKDEKKCHELLLEMKKCRVDGGGDIYAALSTYYHQLYLGKVDAKSKCYHGLLRWCMDLKNDKMFFKFYKEMEIQGIKPDLVGSQYFQKLLLKGGFEKSECGEQSDLSYYNQNISVYISRKDELGVYKVLMDMEINGIKPNERTITLLFNLYATMKNERGIDGVNAIMQKYQIEHNVYTYTSMLGVYVRNRNSEGIYKVIQEMQEKKIEPNEVTYRLLFRFCRNLGDLEGYRKNFEEMKNKGLNPDIDAYNGFLSLCVRNEDQEGFDKIFKEMMKKGLKPNESTYIQCIKHHFYKEDFKEAYNCIDEFKKAFNKPSFQLYKFLIRYYMKHKGDDWADYYYQEMLTQGFSQENIDTIFNPRIT